MSNEQNHKIVFAPGCFDDFEGTQDELDAFISKISECINASTESQRVALSDIIVATPYVYDDEDEEDVAEMEALTAQLKAVRKRILN